MSAAFSKVPVWFMQYLEGFSPYSSELEMFVHCLLLTVEMVDGCHYLGSWALCQFQYQLLAIRKERKKKSQHPSLFSNSCGVFLHFIVRSLFPFPPPLHNAEGLINMRICPSPSDEQQLNKKPLKSTNMLHVILYSNKHFLFCICRRSYIQDALFEIMHFALSWRAYPHF